MDIIARSELPSLPHFKIKEVEELYWNDLTIPDQLYNSILAKDRKSLIKDLRKVLQHAVKDYELFSAEEVNPLNTYFVWHALFLLKDLKAEEAFPDIVNFFKQDESIPSFYLNDAIEEVVWEIFFALGIHQLKQLIDLYESLTDDIWIRPEILRTLQQVALRHPEKGLEVEAYMRRLLLFVQTVKAEEDINIDEAALGIIYAIAESRFARLLPEVKKALAENSLPLYLDIKPNEYEQKYFIPESNKVSLLEFRTREELYSYFGEEEDDDFEYYGDDDDFEDNGETDDNPEESSEKEKNPVTYTIPPYRKKEPGTDGNDK